MRAAAARNVKPSPVRRDRPAGEPFAALPRATLYHGDATTVMAELPPASVDMIFADPPYNLSNGGTTCRAGKRTGVDKGDWDKSRGAEADFVFHTAWIQACRPLLKPHGTLWISGTYHSIYACGHALRMQDWHLLNDIIWYKPNAAPNLACRMFAASHETLLWARADKKAAHYFDYEAMKHGDWLKDTLKRPGRQMRSVWALTGPAKAEKRFGKHPTQKPLALMERIIIASCPPDGLVLDPFCGSGATGVAALRHGRRFIGVDAEDSYLETLALPRLREISQPR